MVVSGRDLELPDAAGSDGVSSAGEDGDFVGRERRTTLISEPGLVLDWLLRERSSFTRGRSGAICKGEDGRGISSRRPWRGFELSIEIVRTGKDDRGDDLVYEAWRAAVAALPAEVPALLSVVGETEHCETRRTSGRRRAFGCVGLESTD